MLKLPHILTKLKSFLRSCNAYGWFVLKLSCIASVINIKVEKERTKDIRHLTHEQICAWATQQDKQLYAPVLAISQLKGHSALGMDACDKQILCVLMQKQPEER